MATGNSIWGRLSQLSRAIAQYDDSTQYSLVDFLVQGTSQIGDLTVANKTPIIERPAHLGVTTLRDVISATGSASVSGTVGDPSIVIRTAENADSVATLSTAEVGRFIPGVGNQVGMAVQIETTPTGSQVYRWGYFDDNDGLFFMYDTDGLAVVRRKGGSDTVTRQADWVGDALDGVDSPDLDIDLFTGQIFYIDYGWYADNEVTFELLTRQGRNRVRLLELHRFPRVGGFPGINVPNLPIRAQVQNDGTTASASMRVAGRYYGALGTHNPTVRTTADFRDLQSGISSGGWNPAISMRTKSAYESVTVKLQGYSAVTNNPILAQIRYDATINGGDWEAPNNRSAGETAVEVNNNMDSATGGESIFISIVPGGNQGQVASNEAPGLNLALPAGKTVTLFLRAVSQNATVTTVLSVNEEW